LLGYLDAAKVNAIRTDQLESMYDDLYLEKSDIDFEEDSN
jgi:hypothetical protein